MVLRQEEHGPKIKMRIPLPQRPAGDREEHVKLQSYVNEKKDAILNCFGWGNSGQKALMVSVR